MRSAKILGIVAAAFIGVAVIAPATAAATPVCGHYIQDGMEYYNNCADHSVKIEIDDWGSNTIMCVPAWTTNELGSDFDISSAWMISTHC